MKNHANAIVQASGQLATDQRGHRQVESAVDLNAGFSGVRVRVKPVKTDLGIKFEAEITSGYRAGNVVCHAQTDIPVRWSRADAAKNWLVETGFTVIPGQENEHAETNGKAWLDTNAAYRLAAIRGGRATPYTGKIMLNGSVIGDWFINTARERGAANGMFIKPEFREGFAEWAREKLDFSVALKLCGYDESNLNDSLAVAFLAGQTLSSEMVLKVKQALKTARLSEKSSSA